MTEIKDSKLKKTYAAFGYLRDAEERLLMVANQYDGHGTMWGVPGGSMEAGETPEECVVREFAEEVGLTVKVTRSVGVIERCKPEWDLDLHATFFEVELLAGEPRIDPHEEHVVDCRFLLPTEISIWPHPVLGRGRLLDYLADPAAYPQHIVMHEDEE
jgi:A/G-specific adenine glycosylase